MTDIYQTHGRGQRYGDITRTVGDTPCVKLNRIAPDHVDIYVKVESFNPLGSVKDRLALNIIEAAERSGQLKPGQTVVEATSGNTGIGLAMVCAARGYPLVITMAGSRCCDSCQTITLSVQVQTLCLKGLVPNETLSCPRQDPRTRLQSLQK